MASRTGARLGRVSRVTAAGDVFVELADVAAGFEFGPCLDTVGGLAVGDRIIAQPLARDEDELVVVGILGGRPGGAVDLEPYATDDDLADGLAGKAPLEHQHHADDVNDGVLALARLPVAPSGNANPTQIVRADDARLSDARTPTAHTHDDRYYTEAEVDALIANSDLKRATVCNNANLTLTGTPTIDGYGTQPGDRILCTGQTSTQNNGLWLIPADSGAWVRPSDYDSAADALAAHVLVQRGTLRGQRIWRNNIASTAAWPVAHTWTDTTSPLTAYPVGAIYLSINSANPSTVFGGTWVAWGTGRVPVAIDTGQTEFNTVEKTGGAKTHTLSAAESGLPAGNIVQQSNGSGYYFNVPGDADATHRAALLPASPASAAHNNLQPYITCYMWKRTA